MTIRNMVAAASAAGILLAGGCGRTSTGGDSFSGRVDISGAWALYPLAVKWAEEYGRIHPQVVINVSAGGAGKGMADVLSGAVDLGMVSRSVSPAETQKGAWAVAVAKDAVVPTVSAAHPALGEVLARGMNREELAEVWRTGGLTNWVRLGVVTRSLALRPYTRSDACGAAETWAGYLGCAQEQLLGVGVYGDPGLAEAVRADAQGIGYNNIGYAYDRETKRAVEGLRVLPIDLDGNGRIDAAESFYDTLPDVMAAIADGRYPTPPSRDLLLVARGVPSRPAVRQFLLWALTEGQAFVREAGYVPLPAERLQAAVAALQQEPR